MKSPLTKVVDQLRLPALGSGDDWSDGRLLGRFIDERDEAAFAALVRRHGPMVWGVCRRLLGQLQDAEDAFQATFLVLARKPASIHPPEAVGNWLYGVAYHIARKDRARAARRRAKEMQVSVLPERASARQASWEDLQPLLDQELSGLPDKYRLLIVLCDVEGRPRREVARQFKIPEGTLSSRLTTARRLLAQRLTRHGIIVPAGVLAAWLGQHAAVAAASSVVSATFQFAGAATSAALIPARVAALAQGVLRTMMFKQLKNGVALVVGAMLLVGAASWAGQSPPKAAAPTRLAQPARVAVQENPVQQEKKKLEGSWHAVAIEKNGKKVVNDEVKDMIVAFEGESIIFRSASGGKLAKGPELYKERKHKFTLDASRAVKRLDILALDGVEQGQTSHCIYMIDGRQLKLVMPLQGGAERPIDFVTREGDGLLLFMLERPKADAPKEKDKDEEAAAPVQRQRAADKPQPERLADRFPALAEANESSAAAVAALWWLFEKFLDDFDGKDRQTDRALGLQRERVKAELVRVRLADAAHHSPSRQR